MGKVTYEEYVNRVNLSLEEKIQWTIERYIDFREVYKDKCFLAFSGGKDSQVMADIIDRLHDGGVR